ncbi:hypothetical protein [Salmonella enterica]|uniref:hypothetical protein n=1 Tax=Salmonella enterica TaxID=28901 RepID=UPI0003BAEBB6|nr:hypothetical protein [Salmonella enterica]EBW7865065.1 hypothetical protein [Salmonella enterica subsp. enterica serovar Newport]ECE0588282.1 hypothetical protein [Salmonella enterica subsp. enterica]ECG4683702.1 hypothetical protein [Salmonella enterica subsp. enterica serovar Stanley]ECH8301231.1 hypothetical protein [Salmonella enterica subsp. enterica serovar Lexington]EDB5948963.1 hypothetical protein [Salmonella enterica subsp. enterica serovar Litchfield]EDP9262194.1 hypothetical pr
MSLNLIWRAVAYLINTSKFQEEVFVFVDAPDRETAKERIYERLTAEWGIRKVSQWDDKPAHIEFHSLCDEKELRDMALGTQVLPGMPLLESGWGGGKAIYDREPLILVASPRLRAVLESALQEVKS